MGKGLLIQKFPTKNDNSYARAGEYGEDESSVSVNVVVQLEREHRPYIITIPDEDDGLEP
jgi:hypothetical protein